MSVLPEVVTEAFGVALVGYVASLALAQGSAKKFKYTVDDNQVNLFILSLEITSPFEEGIIDVCPVEKVIFRIAS